MGIPRLKAPPRASATTVVELIFYFKSEFADRFYHGGNAMMYFDDIPPGHVLLDTEMSWQGCCLD